MDNLKLKAIEYFAAKPHDNTKAKSYLQREYEWIHGVLNESNSYDSISSACEVLEKFISHVVDQSIEDLALCWARLHTSDDLVVDDYVSKYHTKGKLYTKIISLLSKLRYLAQDKIVPILFSFWKDDEMLRVDIERVFKELAEFNLYAVEQIGFTPQVKLLNTIMQLSDREKLEFCPIITTVYAQILSTEIVGHHWEYRTVSIRSMAIPATEEIVKLRQDIVSSLIQMYQSAELLEHKKELLNIMNSACRIWSRAQISDEAKLIVENNTVEVLQYWSSLPKSEPMELIQKIEHDSYWIYYHANSQIIMEAALLVETAIKSNEEYQLYRDLVGFEGIFGSWAKERNLITDYNKQREIREERINTHIESVTKENIDEWLSRVELYLETDSRDLATFPELFKFVEVISNRYPKEVLSRLLETDTLDKSAVPIFIGLLASSIHDEFIYVITDWLDKTKYLWEISVAFLSLKNADLELINKFVDKAISVGDSPALGSFLRVFNKNLECLSDEYVNQLFEKMFVFFNEKQDTVWINNVWFLQKGESFIQALSKENIKLMLDNLVFVNDVDHRIENVLEQIAQKDVCGIFYFFEQRIKYYRNGDKKPEGRYEDIPFSLYSINKTLAEHPEELILLIKRNYEYKYGINKYGIASIIKMCFSPFEPRLIEFILESLSPSIDDELKLILAIASSYEGHSSILPLIRTLLAKLEYDDEKVRWINDSLLSTGVVSGEYGIADAYKDKLSNIKPWLNDNNANVVKFAHQYTELLKELIEFEIKRVNERVALEKHRFGADE